MFKFREYLAENFLKTQKQRRIAAVILFLFASVTIASGTFENWIPAAILTALLVVGLWIID